MKILDGRKCTQNKTTTKAHKKTHNTSVTRETLTEATVHTASPDVYETKPPRLPDDCCVEVWSNENPTKQK